MEEGTPACGTVRGYLFHLWAGTWACSPCEQAHAAFAVTEPPRFVQLGKKKKRDPPPDGFGYCRRCQETKPVEAFRPSEFTQPSQMCKACRAAEQAARGARKRIAS